TYTSHAQLAGLLRRTGMECRIYGLRRDLQHPVRDGSLVYKPFSEQEFIEDLRTARGVVASGGFTLMGGAVYLRRPMLSEPVGKQFEQILNARYLESLGHALQAGQSTQARLGAFRERLPEFGRTLAGSPVGRNRD